ncbi:hypothetical protein [Glutamicibacter arilaitensis]|uniref:hypothetical protein n=1 Tax=Glutamicibacter arilaitensis TaxID=256701 RepID=UPI003F8FE773
MRLIEQVEIATTIANEIYAGALNAHDAASTAALELLPLIGKAGFTEAARRHAAGLHQLIENANWINPAAKERAEGLHLWLDIELKHEA